MFRGLKANRWSLSASALTALLGALTAYFLFHIPIQLSDSLANLLQVQDASLEQLVSGQFRSQGYLRPALWAELKVVFDAAAGHYFFWFRTIHVLMVVSLLVAVLAVVRVRTAVDFVAAMACLAIVLGLHTFAGTIREAFPINSFLTIALCCVATVAIARARHRAWFDLLPAALFTYAVLTVETGLLVWVACVTAYVVGFRGVSRRGVLLVTAAVAAYFVLRFGIFHAGTPGLAERSTGFGFVVLEPSDLIARFGRNPYPLYLYNVVCGISTVLFGEPRGGVWRFVGDISQGSVQPWVAINVVTCSLTTVLIAMYIVGRRRAWLTYDLDDGDRLVLLFLVILPANAAISFPYAKDVVMSPAGVFYALAAFVAFRHLIVVPTSSTGLSRRPATALIVLLAVVSTGWGLRLLGIDYSLLATAESVRTEWAFDYEWEANNRISITSPAGAALKRTLYDDAIWRRPAPRQLALRWAERVFDKTQ